MRVCIENKVMPIYYLNLFRADAKSSGGVFAELEQY